MSQRSLQLSLRETPTAFDFSVESELLVVSSNSDLTFFHLADLGSPRQVVYYEQPVLCSSVRLQQGPQSLVACVNSGCVSVWDPARCVKPMLDFIPSSRRINSVSWSPAFADVLATASTAGSLGTWDCRAGLRPCHELLCRACEKVEWSPHNPYLLAAAVESRYVLVWDVRMLPGSESSAMGMGIPTPQRHPTSALSTPSTPTAQAQSQSHAQSQAASSIGAYCLLEPEGGVAHFGWAADPKPSLYVVTLGRQLQSWGLEGRGRTCAASGVLTRCSA
eukprot:CAMPEP_0173329508 /NCGR_PEP_ID=MMETSP1144-20121109/2749_1 /TAXON_ID=483371 /ORGANISM="non described non described, Strain CCMP2298" /LENGTH=276 /DNA_ID=CAMNT_0014274115 /DNA_START=100 /DNA_END=926 /DNA_ORIENTATION=+